MCGPVRLHRPTIRARPSRVEIALLTVDGLVPATGKVQFRIANTRRVRQFLEDTSHRPVYRVDHPGTPDWNLGCFQHILPGSQYFVVTATMRLACGRRSQLPLILECPVLHLSRHESTTERQCPGGTAIQHIRNEDLEGAVHVYAVRFLCPDLEKLQLVNELPVPTQTYSMSPPVRGQPFICEVSLVVDQPDNPCRRCSARSAP